MAATAGPKAGIIDVKDLRYFLRIFSKNWYFVVIAIILSAVLSYLYSYKIPDVYGASTRILLKDNRVYDYQNQVFNSIGYVSAFGDIANQRRVVTSYDMIDRTLSKLDFDVSYYIIGRFKTSEMYGGMPFEVQMEVLNSKLYEKPFDLQVLSPTKFELRYDRGSGLEPRIFPFNTDIADPDFALRVDLSPEVTRGNIEKFTNSTYRFVRHSRPWLVERYTSGMTVGNPDGTSILEVTVEDEIPARAKMFLDTLSKEYIDYTLRSEFDINENTLTYIDRQMDEVSVILNKSEDDLQNFLLKQNILDLNKENDRYYDELVGYDTKKREYGMMIESVDALEKYILNIGEGKLLPPSFYILNDDVFLKQTLSDLYDMQMKRNHMLYPATEGNPATGQLDNSIQLTKANLLIYLKNTREAIREKIGDVDEQIGSYEELIRNIPQKQRDIQNIQRQVDVNEKLYSFLLEKRANTVIARAGIVPQTKVIETARVLGVIRPDKVKILYTFIVGGGILSMILVFVRVLFYDRIENADQLREATNLPVFGEIIASEKAEENYVVVDSDPKSAITESFRTIRTNLEYLPQTEGGKVVMVTSYRPNEGKTFCSVNLSAILAKAGKKVLLLELDLHKPKVGAGLDMNSPTGLSNILVGKAGFAECVQATQIENFHVILSGPTPPNASELILSRYLIDLFAYGRQHYDYVLIDTPPVGLITDALLMMRHVDATLFVINTRFASKDHVQNALEIHRSNTAHNFGLILNGVKMKKSKYYYNTNYGYGYRYAYGYGNGYGYGYGRRRSSKEGESRKKDINA